MIRCLLLLRVLLQSVFAGILVQAPSAWAQPSYPARPIRIIVPFSPGGGGDLMARKIAVKLADRTVGEIMRVLSFASLVGLQWRVIYQVSAGDRLIQVVQVTPHDYRRS